MVFDVFRRERTDVFWIVGSGFKIRHAMTTLPGSVYTGAWVPALCETWILIPTATPWPREPLSKTITERCPECTTIANRKDHHEHTWDY
jgi:hypothetical protein